jgi:hypothetical protein
MFVGCRLQQNNVYLVRVLGVWYVVLGLLLAYKYLVSVMDLIFVLRDSVSCVGGGFPVMTEESCRRK